MSRDIITYYHGGVEKLLMGAPTMCVRHIVESAIQYLASVQLKLLGHYANPSYGVLAKINTLPAKQACLASSKAGTGIQVTSEMATDN